MTLGLAVGAIWAQRQSALLGRAWYSDTKVIAGLIGWLIYAAVVHVRLFGRISARRAAILTIAGFLVALATFAAAHAYPGQGEISALLNATPHSDPVAPVPGSQWAASNR